MRGGTRRVVFNMRDDRPAWSPPAWVTPRLREALPPGFELVDVAAPVSGRGDGGGSSAEARAAVRGAEVYLGLGLPRDLLDAALQPPSQLRWAHTGTAGVASLLHPELAAHRIALTNSAGVHGPPMAETVLAALLHFARGLDHAVAAQRSATWGAATFEDAASGVRELDGATIGVIGFGGIGREVARRATAFGMRVLALRRRHGDADAGTSEAVVATDATAGGSVAPARRDVEILAGDHGLQRVLAESDYIVLCVPSTPATRGMIGAAEIARMKRDAVLVNVGRGDVLDEEALARALAEGHLRGAALDVFATEPLPPTSPLWRLRNVLVTPHVAATSPRFWERETELIIDNIRRYAGGEPLRNTVDIEAGY